MAVDKKRAGQLFYCKAGSMGVQVDRRGGSGEVWGGT